MSNLVASKMNDMIALSNNANDCRMSSRQVAELTGKQHKHVMRDIRSLIEQGLSESNFGLSSYIDSTGRNLPEYQLTKKGCLILASGYNAVLREKIIDRWEELENASKFSVPQTYSEALMLAAQQACLIEKQNEQLQLAAPKVEYYEQVIKSTDTVTTTLLAKEFGMSAIKMNKLLQDLGIQFKVGESWKLKAAYSGKGYVDFDTVSFMHNSGKEGSSVNMKWTQKGRQFVINLLKNYGYQYGC